MIFDVQNDYKCLELLGSTTHFVPLSTASLDTDATITRTANLS
jgi:hypothetical protein